jgi:hypothetical protein
MKFFNIPSQFIHRRINLGRINLGRINLGVVIASFCGMLLGCSAYKRIDSVPTTFLEGVDTTKSIDNLPFSHAWVKPGFDGRMYRKVYLPKIRTDLLPIDQWKRSSSPLLSSKQEYNSAAEEIASFFRTQLIEGINKYPENRFLVVDTPGSDVLTLQIALTELEFSHPIARGASLAAPIPGTGPVVSSISDPHVAFAARILNPSGQLVATVADRRFPPTRIVDLNKLTVSSSAREICSLWASTMAEALNKGRFVKTEREGRFSISPW